MRWLGPILAALLALTACGRDSGSRSRSEKEGGEETAAAAQVVGKKAVLGHDLDINACLTESVTVTDDAPATCPTYVLQSLDYMQQECTSVGGALQATELPEVWKLDADADGSDEVLIDLNENLICYGAPSVFACGSLGCPYFLYDQRTDKSWFELGAFNADDAPSIEVLPGEPGRFATLRGGCLGERPCSELTHYEWKGNAYQRTWIDSRGHIVDVVPGGLWTLTRDTPVQAAPSRGAQVLDEYPVGTAVVVLGNARKGPYKYISPCNACRRGFVETAVLKKES